jgi:hypothetical protein
MNSRPAKNENLAYHVARLLILIGYCGKPQTRSEKLPGVQGRTLLAKLDFFMRYPSYLKLAAQKMGVSCENDDLGVRHPEDINTVESHMVRYLYGPWDSLYYVAIAYMVGKGLIEPPRAEKVEQFRITPFGKHTLELLEKDPSFADLIQRANTIYRLFNAYSGSRLKDFIYRNFPEVVNRGIGEQI